ncbi:MAG: bifunctional folylpolyglutamate synthase/dihydrofolate synthase [Thermoplasmata archaeon HGW-Thermoplasmata-1]|nr:MAG: bifunctional folylpolyglutamate synthase/dihydrofolate synthase [Thermoplasmata archaeon HGW-Thermoplasmata-1]
MRFGLDNTRMLLERLGNPQNSLRIVHVGGTNGKGSACRYIYSILREAGHSVGIYTSPHLERFNERIVVGDEEVSDAELEELASRVKPIADEMAKGGRQLTFFEATTAMALLHFAKRNVDIAVLEVGLGGKLDATNIVAPLVSVITNVTLEHTDVLGKTVREIAEDKAHIIKPGVPSVTAARGDALEEIRKRAEAVGSRLSAVGEEVVWKRLDADSRKQRFFIRTGRGSYELETVMLGEHQGENLALAVAACETLCENGIAIPKESFAAGAIAARWPGRLEVVLESPLTILDGAHNPDGMKKLARFISADIRPKKLTLVIGMLRDKDIESSVSELLPLASRVIITTPLNERAEAAGDAARRMARFAVCEPVAIGDVREAVDEALSGAGAGETIIITGSLYMIGEARRYLNERA